MCKNSPSGDIEPENIFKVGNKNDLKENINNEQVIEAMIEVTEMLGSETFLYMKTDDVNLTAKVNPRSIVKPFDVIKLAIDTKKIHLFDKDTEETITN